MSVSKPINSLSNTTYI